MKFSTKCRVAVVLIAIPSASGQQTVKIVDYCAAAKLRFRTIALLSEKVTDGRNKPIVREVSVEHLLGRTPVHLDKRDVRAKAENQTILVTGAGGSIGSELCHQLALFRPKSIIGLDAAETPLFQIDREMRHAFSDIHFEPQIGDIRDFPKLASIFAQHRPSIVFHAAAYKHVPLMESHIFEAIENNVIGTFNVATAAAHVGAKDFVMISSDKAVRPTSVMGLTKRVAEIVINSLPACGGKYVSVRFGNVLGSNGSVVTVFREQIAAGGPVTVTHPEMRRYFMTIPEAVQLVLQAFTMGKGGEIFVLDMGEAIKIVDLAKHLVLLSGLRPGEDIEIEFTGIRAGEKLFEELSAYGEGTCQTYHDKIRIFQGNGSRIMNVGEWVEDVRRMCVARDLEVLLGLKDLVSDYTPSTQLMRLLFRRSTALPQALAASIGT